MRTGLTTYAALILFVILAPLLLGSLLFAPGLVGLLQSVGLGWLAGAASFVFSMVIVLMLVLAAWSARGTYHVNEHVRDMLPWAITVIGIVAVVSALR